MRQAGNVMVAVVFSLLITQASFLPVSRASAAPVQFSQVIRPLYCIIDVVADGPSVNVYLAPAECVHSAQATQLLADTRSALLDTQSL